MLVLACKVPVEVLHLQAFELQKRDHIYTNNFEIDADD